MARNLMVAGNRKPQLKKPSTRNWTKAKEREFLSVLAETCNVSQAAEQAGVSTSYAYKKRSTNAAFRAGWSASIAIGFQRLELVLLDRAFNGTEKLVTRRDGSEERMLEYSNQLGLSLLKMHRETAVEGDTEFTSESADEIRERLIKKLKRLKARNDAEDAADQ